MPLYIKDDETADMVAEVARRLKTSFEQKLADFHARNPLPEPTGEVADKAFFDELSGEVD